MDALTKFVIKKGIPLSTSFSYPIKDRTIEYSTTDILLKYSKTSSKDEYKNSISHVKKATRELALSFINGIGQRNAIIEVYGYEKYTRFEYTTMNLSLTNEPILFRVTNPEVANWVMQKKGNACYLYRQDEKISDPMSIEQLFTELCTRFDPDDIEIDFVDGDNGSIISEEVK